MSTSKLRGRPRSRVTPLHLFAAAALLGLLIMPVAFAQDSGTATKSANLKKQVKGLKQRVAALEGKTSLPPSGPAGGELAGTYPNPQVGTVSGLSLAPGTTPAGGIDFGAGWSLYRDGTDFLRLDNELLLAETAGGATGIFADGEGALAVNSTGADIGGTIRINGLKPTAPLVLNNQALLRVVEVAGKDRIVARFGSGADVLVATEP